MIISRQARLSSGSSCSWEVVMILRVKVVIPIVIAVCVFATVICTSKALASSTISEVSVSPDFRRVAIKSDGQIVDHTSAVMTRPSRLVINIPSASVAPDPRILGLDKDSPLRLRIAKTASSAQVALDFGTAPVPEHTVRQIDNYLIVLLGEWQPQPRAQAQPEPVKTPARHPVSASPEKDRDPVIHAAGSEILIKSAEEVNGTIVLKVAKRTEPQRVYRIDLGVDFQHLGFNGASVCPLGGRPEGSGLLAGKTSSWAQPSAHGKKIGPRKMLAPKATGRRAAPTIRKPSANPRLSPLARIRGKYQGNPDRVESGRVRPYTQLAGGITRKKPD
jgi:hypothetical protein